MEVSSSSTLESELLFLTEENQSPSPQPQPDLLIDLANGHAPGIHIDETEEVEDTSMTSLESAPYSLVTNFLLDPEPEPEPEPELTLIDEDTNEIETNEHEKTQSVTMSESKTVTKTVKKKKSSSRTESISVAARLPDVFAGVSVVRVRRSFGDLSQLQDDETDGDHETRSSCSKRPKSCTDGIQAKNSLMLELGHVSVAKLKSSLSKFDMLERQQKRWGTEGNNKLASAAAENNKEQAQPVEEQKKVCKACGKNVFAMDGLKAEKADWHKTCFRCETCKKVLSVEAYSSHEGRLFCKVHFRDLFQPKVALEEETAISAEQKKLDKTEVIIRESQPAPLPEGVVRASDPTETGLEDLHLDLKSKFELFESLKNQEDNKAVSKEPIEIKRCGSVLAKLAKYQSKVGMDGGAVGVPDEALAGGVGPSDDGAVSSDEEADMQALLRKPQVLDEINSEAVDSVRNKWALGMNSRSELVAEHRKEEQSKFRTRLLLGKNSQLKEMYEKALVADTSDSPKPLSPDDCVKDKAKDLKQLFEKGDFRDEPKSPDSKLEGEVFESAIAKQSRQLFRELDKSGGQGFTPNSASTPKPKRLDRTESVNVNNSDVIRSCDMVEEIVKPSDLGSKFKFFEEGGADKKSEKKAFRITPPRETKAPSPEVEIYRDPSIVRSSEAAEPEIPVTRTASKMLSVFRQLEQLNGEDANNRASRPLKEFTPPREPARREQSSEEESDEEPEEEVDGLGSIPQKDEALKEVGSLARASSLRAKFERWEAEENERNVAFEKESPSIESTKDLRAKFENLKREEEERKAKRAEVKVNRFVELQNSGVAMENCVECSKRVYVMEKTEAGGKIYHKSCFRCSHCKCQLRMDTFTSNKGTLFCTPHFKQLFKVKGNYDEGFGHETQKAQWEKKKAGSNKPEVEDKEN